MSQICERRLARHSRGLQDPGLWAKPKHGKRAMENEILNIVDERANATYDIPLHKGAVRATGLGQINTNPDDFGVMSATAVLSGPLHGCANGRVLKMLDEISSRDRVPAYVKHAKEGRGRNESKQIMCACQGANTRPFRGVWDLSRSLAGKDSPHYTYTGRRMEDRYGSVGRLSEQDTVSWF